MFAQSDHHITFDEWSNCCYLNGHFTWMPTHEKICDIINILKICIAHFGYFSIACSGENIISLWWLCPTCEKWNKGKVVSAIVLEAENLNWRLHRVLLRLRVKWHTVSVYYRVLKMMKLSKWEKSFKCSISVQCYVKCQLFSSPIQ